MIELLACKLGRNDEIPNIELAENLCENNDKSGVYEIVEGLKSKDQPVANDCIKVLYEIGKRKPELIADFVDVFIHSLSDKSNRIVWGSMMALAFITPIKPDEIFNNLSKIIEAYKKGSVITVDNSISVLALLCKARSEYHTIVLPILREHLENCRPKEIPQHFERIMTCMNSGNKDAFIKAIEARTKEMTEAQNSRVSKLLKLCKDI